MVKAARRVLPKSLPGRLIFRAKNRIPLARGLGSSAAAVVAGLWAGAHLFGTLRRSEDELEDLAVEIEGHPDNVAPCVHGGLTASVYHKGDLRVQGLEIHPSFSGVVCVPDRELPTRLARKLLPKRVTLEDAVFNLQRAVLLPRALSTARVTYLRQLMEDRLHQPYRAPKIPGMHDAIDAAYRAGAAGAALSGSGTTVFALVEGGAGPRVGEAMRRAFRKKRVSSRAFPVAIDHHGVRIES
jgi:homoserine kinase